jgi:glycogen phosphorylase
MPVISKEMRASEYKNRMHRMASENLLRTIAYFSMEYALFNWLRIYSGGLGVLAGDTMKSAADLKRPVIPLGLLYHEGFFTQRIIDGRQTQKPQIWSKKRSELIDLQEVVTLPIAGKEVAAKLWGVEPREDCNFAPPLLLDTMGVPNPTGFDEITKHLYPHGAWERLTQEILLGVGGVRALAKLGLPIGFYHLNEGHASFAAVEVLRQLGRSYDQLTPEHIRQVQRVFSFTTHTPVPAGFDRFEKSEIKRALTDLFMQTVILNYGADPQYANCVNMALLGMRLSGGRNGVSLLHGKVSDGMFPDLAPFLGITNGVHHLTWTAPATKRFLDKHAPEWRRDPTKLTVLKEKQADQAVRDELWQTHQENKAALLGHVEKKTGVRMDQGVFTIGFARRFATYKRGDLIFTDPDSLLRLAEEHGGLQIVMSGKAHPADGPGKNIIAKVIEEGAKLTARSDGAIKFVFLEDYEPETALLLVSGTDVWLNNPLRPHEASGTSGEKAAFNGNPNVSILDGWWAEHRGGGWDIGDPQRTPPADDPMQSAADSADLYRVLAEVMRCYRERGSDPAFVDKMFEALHGNASYFNTHRMFLDYERMVWNPGRANSLLIAHQPAARPAVSEIEMVSLGTKAGLALGEAVDEARVEEIAAETLLKTLSGSQRVVRYDAHNEAVQVARGWAKGAFGTSYEERRLENGVSGFGSWKQMKEFSGEVMADVLRTGKPQFVLDPVKDSRCYRDGHLVNPEPFILVPEIINGEIRGVYKIDFRTGELQDTPLVRAAVDSLLEAIGQRRAHLQAAALVKDFAGYSQEERASEWMLRLLTAGGFVNMPRFAAVANRAALFSANEVGTLVGWRAVGETNRNEHAIELGRVSPVLFSLGTETYVRSLGANGALTKAIADQRIGPSVIAGTITVADGQTSYRHEECDPDFTTAKLAQIREAVEKLFMIDGQTVNSYLLLPFRPGTGPDGLVYVDNGFDKTPLHTAKYQAIIAAAANRIAEIRRGAAK